MLPGPRGDGRALSAFDVVYFADGMEIRETVWRYGDEKRVVFSLFRAGGELIRYDVREEAYVPVGSLLGDGFSSLHERDDDRVMSCEWLTFSFRVTGDERMVGLLLFCGDSDQCRMSGEILVGIYCRRMRP